MEEIEKNNDLYTHPLWWLFKETVDLLDLTDEEILLIKRKLEEKIYEQQSDT